ncbi:MAG: hypothetical protein FJ395_08390 [Verrucomicrobia bacterium]|nr:hypothetical protein [Verrucomicrobiota bacterium]
MRTHQAIDQRSLALAQAVVSRIDEDPTRRGLGLAQETCARWLRDNPSPVLAEWAEILKRDWQQVRSVLLDAGTEGQRLRQSSPFCGVLSPSERWVIYQQFADEQKVA